MIGERIQVIVDRPLGSYRPEYLGTKYSVNYGYIKEFVAGDGEYQDAYILGAKKVIDDLKDMSSLLCTEIMIMRINGLWQQKETIYERRNC